MAETRTNKVKSSELELKDKLVALNRVTKVTKGGRTFTFAAIVVVGNGNGVVGHGLGKAKEVQEAIAKGIDFKVAKLPMAYAGRFVAENEGGSGLCKVLVGTKHGEVIGVHMLGNPASEMIYGACIAIEQEMTLTEMQKVVFPHPTVSEILKEVLFSF